MAAGPPSPENPALPVPAITVMPPEGVTSITCCKPVSATHTLPEASTATPRGIFQPDPTLVTVPPGERLETRAAPASVKNRLPCESSASPRGEVNPLSKVAGTPLLPAVRIFPAPESAIYRVPEESANAYTGEISPSLVAAEMTPPGVTLRIRALPVSAMYRLPEASTVTEDGPFNSAAVAAPPSPEFPATPVPATVTMVPSGLRPGGCGCYRDPRYRRCRPRPRWFRRDDSAAPPWPDRYRRAPDFHRPRG